MLEKDVLMAIVREDDSMCGKLPILASACLNVMLHPSQTFSQFSNSLKGGLACLTSMLM